MGRQGQSRGNDHASDSMGGNKPLTAPDDLTADSVYEFYVKNLFPAIWASLPLLLSRIGSDAKEMLRLGWSRFVRFLLPSFDRELDLDWTQQTSEKFKALWDQAKSGTSNSSFAEFMMRHFDADNDGHISPSELQTILLPALRPHYPQTWVAWFNRTWPLIDWKVGIFLWRTCGGLLLIVAVASIVPGRLHGITGRLLRWPILGLTYFMITVELIVYIMIRVFIRLVEAVFANSKHRTLRRKMARAQSYEEWYETARALDISQGRDRWQEDYGDDSSYRYNWSFIKELMTDMRHARDKRDSILALAVLQQCSRRNVGGVMSEEQFTYTNTGEPKHIVEQFMDEVVLTLKWVTEEASKIPSVDETVGETGKDYEERLRKKSQQEKNKIWSSVVSWATLSFGAKDHEIHATRPSVRVSKSLGDIKSDLSTTRSTPCSPIPPSSSSVDSQTPPPSNLPSIHRDTVITFLKRARASYGRSALCLSGGSMMGSYHFGHVKALIEEDCLPHIISGTSAGSVVGALICTRTDDEIRRDMRPEVLESKLIVFGTPWPERLRNLYRSGYLFETKVWIDLVKWFTCDDLTFEEAYKKTGRVLCITLSATTKKAPPVLLNYITAPNVVIASAVVASAAVPGFIPPVLLQIKDVNGVVRDQVKGKDQLYWDGSIEQDIPTSGLAEMFNCQFFLAAQANPHIVPFFYNSKGAVGRPSRWSSVNQEHWWRGGFLLSALELYLKSDMRAKFHFLNDLEAAIGFTSTLMTQQYEGTTTIVPQVSVMDYIKLFCVQSLSDLRRYFQGGSVAAYQHCAMIKMHYRISHALDECLARLELQDGANVMPPRRRIQILAKQLRSLEQLDGSKGLRRRSRGSFDSETESSHDDEYERGGFDGMIPVTTRRCSSFSHGSARGRSMSDN